MGTSVFGPATDIELGTWQHVALVKPPGEYTVYLNGSPLASGSLPPSLDGPNFFPGTDNTGDRTIGGDSGTFSGYLDEFRISDTALTPDQFLCSVPEPSTLGLLLLGAAGLAWRKRARRAASTQRQPWADMGQIGAQIRLVPPYPSGFDLISPEKRRISRVLLPNSNPVIHPTFS